MKDIKNIIKMIITHFFMISVCVMFITALIDVITGDFSWGYTYQPSYPWLIMLTGLLGALPSALFYFRKEPTKKQFYMRVVIHWVMIEAVIMTEGFFLGWYHDFLNAFIIFAIILIVYGMVWFFSAKTTSKDAVDINEALKKLNSEEE